jgi:iron complex outermembrane receptor protein
MRGSRRVVNACMAGAVLWTGAAMAEDETGDLVPVEEVTVTATRVAEPVFNIPASIDRIDGNAFNDDSLGISLSSGLASIPGVVVRDRQNYAQDTQISIRGFGARSAFGIRGIRLYVDGIPATQPDGQGQVSHFNLAAAERVEVLRGPFSVLYGNAAGGVVQLFTADGSEPTRLFGGVTAGSYGSYRTHLGAGGTVGDADYRFDYTHFGTDGYRDHSSAQRDAVNGKLGFKLGERGRLTLLINGLYAPDADDPLGLTRAQFDADPRQVAPQATQFNTRKSVDQIQGGAIYDHDLGNGQALRLLAYYGQRSVEQFLSIPAAPQGNPTHSGGVVDLGTDYHGVDLRWSWRMAALQRPLTVIAGLSYDDLSQHRRGYENFIGSELGVRGALRRDEINDIDSLDPYLQTDWQFAERWSLMAGLRYNRVRFSSDDRYIATGNVDDSGSAKYSASTPVLGVMFRQNPALHWYASWGRGFETPTFAELAYRPDGGAGLNYDLDAARNDSFELGSKLRLGAHTRAQLALFRIDTEKELLVASNVGGRATYRNSDDTTRRMGVELSSAHTLAPRWHLDFSWTWIDAELDGGHKVPGVSKSSLYGALRWGAEQGWFAALDSEYRSRVPVNDANAQYAPSYALSGLSGGYVFALPSGRVRTFLRIDNVFDKQYAGSVIANDGNGRFYEPGPERSFIAGVSFDWAP